MKLIERTLNHVTVPDLDGNLVAKARYLASSGLGEPISGYTARQPVSGHLKLLHFSHRLQHR